MNRPQGNVFVVDDDPSMRKAVANLFAPVDEDDALGAVAAALAAGVRHLDTAPYYGYGLSEARLGRALAGLPRAGITVSTKVGYELDPKLARAR